MISPVRIKICGITRPEDAVCAASLGVDAMGFVFYPKSPRYIRPEDAALIIEQLPPFISAVGLFVNPTQDEIDDALNTSPLDVIQLHGDETPAFCKSQKRRVIKAIPIAGKADLARAGAYDCPILLDARAPAGVYGGTGESFDWSLLQGFDHPRPVVLAGGLKPDNVRQALDVRQWFAVDVSSGVEAEPGIKDADKMRRFVAHVHQFAS
ncbi:MAG: phosphoribosylanthranilate isomerase [Mariprofundaceae bacterium]